jgi:hypothetical protein
MRHSVYTFPHELLQIATAAMRSQNAKVYANTTRALGNDYAAHAVRIESALREGPLSGAELR